MALLTLGPIRSVYFALHQGTSSGPTQFSASTGNGDNILRVPSSYPLCKVKGHIHDGSVSTALAHTVLHHDAAPVPVSHAGPDALHRHPVPPFSSTAPPAAVAPLTSPSSASSNPALENILPTGPLLSLHSPMARSDLSPSRPESHRSVIVLYPPSASPWPTSAPDLRGAAAEDDGRPKPVSRKVLDPPR
ncbi:hypothetical protein BJY52DRAFT_503171 [Lactarius psammicola]|nr:hypothetical protein BJY52DRAFT_503171 [Lactarius psammicola]